MTWIESSPPILMRSYVAWCSFLNRIRPQVVVDGLTFRVSPTTYKPIHDEGALAADIAEGQRVLDLGTGSGIIAISAARRGARVTASDISPTALADAAGNAERLGVADRIDFVSSDCYERIDGSFDVIVSHLPYVELDIGTDEDSQWAATATTVAERVIEGARRHLRPGGRLMLLWPAEKGERVEALAAQHGLAVDRSERWPSHSRKLAALRLLYFDVGFASTLYTIRAAEESRGTDR